MKLKKKLRNMGHPYGGYTYAEEMNERRSCIEKTWHKDRHLKKTQHKNVLLRNKTKCARIRDTEWVIFCSIQGC